MLDSLLQSLPIEVTSVGYRAKCLLLSKKISDNQTLLQIFKKNNPDYEVMGDFKCPLYGMIIYFQDGRKTLVLTSSDNSGRNIIDRILKNMDSLGVLQVSIPPFELGVRIAEEHFVWFDDREIDQLLSEKGLPTIERSSENLKRKQKQIESYDKAFRKSLLNRY
jgi:hypothetical protein